MIYFLLVLLILILILFLVLFLRTKIVLKYEDKKLTVTFKILFLRLKFDLNRNKGKEKEKQPKQRASNEEISNEKIGKKLSDFKEKYEKYRDFVDFALSHLRYKIGFEKWKIRIEMGTGNAASTGIAQGMIWAVAGSVYGFLAQYFDFKSTKINKNRQKYTTNFPEIDIIPHYNDTCFEIEAGGIIYTRLVHIIPVVIRLLKITGKREKTVE